MITAAILLERSDWLIGSWHCRTRWHVYLVFFFFHSIVLKHYYTLLPIETNLENVVK